MGQVTRGRSLHARNDLLSSSAFVTGTGGWFVLGSGTNVFWAFGLMVLERSGADGVLGATSGSAGTPQLLAPVPGDYTGVVYSAALVSASAPTAGVRLGVWCGTAAPAFLERRDGPGQAVTAGPGNPQWVASGPLSAPSGTERVAALISTAGSVPVGRQVYVHRVQLAFRPFTVWSQGPVL